MRELLLGFMLGACCAPRVIVTKVYAPCLTARPPLDRPAELPDWSAEAWLRCGVDAVSGP